MFEGLRNFVSFFELEFLPEERLRPSLSIRLLMALGGAIYLVFGMLTSFSMRLAFNWLLWLTGRSKGIVDFYPLELQSHPHTYSFLLTALGGALCIIASFRRRWRSIALLSLWGATLGLIGLSLSICEFMTKYWSGIVGCDWFLPGTQCLIPGSGYSIILLGVLLVLSYLVSIGVLHLVISVPLAIPASLNLLAYLQLPILILMAQLVYTSFLFWILLAIVLVIPIRIRFMALPQRSTHAQSSQISRA